MTEENYESEESPFNESEYASLFMREEPESATQTELPVNPIENFEVIPDNYEKARPRIVVISNATIEPD
jgi:hypothetical protein